MLSDANTEEKGGLVTRHPMICCDRPVFNSCDWRISILMFTFVYVICRFVKKQDLKLVYDRKLKYFMSLLRKLFLSRSLLSYLFKI